MNGLDLPVWFVLPFLFVVGTVIGSFLNVCIYRLPKSDHLWEQLKGLSWPPSSCPGCANRIPRSDNVPIIGWLKLGGRCRFCRTRISMRYPLIELLNGLLFVGLYLVEMPDHFRRSIADSCLYAVNGPQIVDIWPTWAWLHWRYLYHLVLIEALIVATFIDFDTMTIPDGVTVPAMIVGVIGGGALGQVFLVPVWFQKSNELHIWKTVIPKNLWPLLSGPNVPGWIVASPHLHGLANSVAGLLVGGGIVWAVRIIGKWILKREAMGFGDVTLMAAIGSFVGWQPVLVVFFIAPFCAIVVALTAMITRRSQEIPYGPYLSIATLVMLVAWPRVWPPAEKVFQLGVFVVVFIVLVPILLAGCLSLVQIGKRMLGIPLYVPEELVWEEERWLSADQLAYLAGENVDDRQGQWQPPRWPGTDSGRGLDQQNRWRHGGAGSPGSLYQRMNGRR